MQSTYNKMAQVRAANGLTGRDMARSIMARNGISASEAEGHLGQWAEEDFYVPLPDELRLIADAGFPRPDVFWRDGEIAVYGAFKGD